MNLWHFNFWIYLNVFGQNILAHILLSHLITAVTFYAISLVLAVNYLLYTNSFKV